MSNSVTKDGEYVVIRVHQDDAHGLRVALAPCPCKAPKSNATAAIRERLRRALGTASA